MDQGIIVWDKWSFLRSDQTFDQFYPAAIRKLSEMHWTPLDIVEDACEFLVAPGAKILDVGSGAGKFCIAGGLLHPETIFYGIEQREQLSFVAEQVRKKTGAHNVRLRHGNITSLNGADYDHFYYYNAFCEQVQPWGRIDSTVPMSLPLYRQYQAHLHDMLRDKPQGTKLVTYHTPNAEVPSGYKLVKNTHKKCLKFWIKKG